MQSIQRYRFCLLAGLFAASGSFFGKLPSLLKDSTIEIYILNSSGQAYAAFVLYQCLPILLMVCSNLLNWRYFLKGLQMTEQTLTATVLTAASNYVVTFLYGILVFKETFSLLSILGCIFTVSGLWFLFAGDQKEKPKLKNG